MSLPCFPDPSPWVEFLKTVPNIVTAITAIVGVCIAKAGLDKWHAETIGKRKAELAEQALTAFNEVRDVFVWVRSPGGFGGEGSTRRPAPIETEAQQRERNFHFVPIERLVQEKELFARLQTLQYPFVAYFGEDARAPFTTIRGVHASITSAAGVLIQITDEDGHGGYDGGAQLKREIWGDGNRPDLTDQKIDKAVQDIEDLCRPVLAKAK